MRKIGKNAFVVIGHCPKARKIYGITVDELRVGHYCFVWTFKLDEKRAKHEGFGEKSVNGSVEDDAEYPGCPYCGSKDKVVCNCCGAMLCYYGQGEITCPNCGMSGPVEYVEKLNLKGGSM